MRGPLSLAVLLTATSLAASSLAACDDAADPADDTGQEGGGSDAPVEVEGGASNVVLILTDDQDRASVADMPKLQRDLADQGVTFTDAYATVPECCPSRASIFTGQYAHNHGVVSNEPPDGGVDAFDDTNALPVWLQDAGYSTAYVGKYLNGYGWRALDHNPTEIPAGWDHWVAPTDHTEYRMYGYTLNETGELVDYGDSPGDYQTDVVADHAAERVERLADGDEPFFLTVAPVAPHDEGVLEGADVARNPRPAPRHVGAFEDRGLPDKPSFDEADVADKPEYVSKDPRLNQRERDELLTLYRSRLESLLAVDDLVGRVVETLDQAGELEDTLLIYTSDNGFLLGEHRQLGKEKVYEESSGVPLIVRGPGFPEGAVEQQPVGNIDLAPTILTAAGVEPGVAPDGVPLQAVLDGSPDGARPALLLELLSEHTYTGVRSGRYVYAQRQRGDVELYDLDRDPLELSNLAGQAAYSDTEERLSGMTARLRDCAGADCR
jgi:N-acetylglucosamine-6-sulfatase